MQNAVDYSHATVETPTG